MSDAWYQKAEQAGLINTVAVNSRHAVMPVSAIGVSIGYVKKLLESLPTALRDAEMSTLVAKVIFPLTARPPIQKRGRMFDIIPSCHTGVPCYYLVHTRASSLEYLTSQLLDHMLGPSMHNEKLTTKQQRILDNTYVWLDWIAMNQCLHVTSIADVTHVRELVTSCSKGALVILDPGLEVLSRAWCLYEMWAFMYYGHIRHLKLVLPDGANVATFIRFTSLVRKMDLMRATSTRQHDTRRLIATVRSCCGLKIFHRLMHDALVLSLKSGLRWSDRVTDKALLCQALMHQGEYGQLMIVLHGMPELTDDDHVLKDIKDIFCGYDIDNSGALDAEEFIQVLVICGYNKEEAQRVFLEVDTHEKKSIGLEEFEEWWLRSQRHELGVKLKNSLAMKTEVLIPSCIKLTGLMERNGLKEGAAYTMSMIQHLKSELKEGPIVIGPNPLRADWKLSVDQIAFKITLGDLRTASGECYELLVWNSDQIDEDPASLENPEHTRPPLQIIRILGIQLKLLCSLLKLHEKKEQHVRLFERYMELFEDPKLTSSLLMNMAAAESKAYNGPGATKFAVLNGMVNLKYGEDTPLDRSRMMEAELANSVWTASCRKGVDAVENTYLGSYSSHLYCGDTALVKPPNKNMHTLTHDIPADGPYTSILASLGPEAKAFWKEMERKEAEEAAAAIAEPIAMKSVFARRHGERLSLEWTSPIHIPETSAISSEHVEDDAGGPDVTSPSPKPLLQGRASMLGERVSLPSPPLRAHPPPQRRNSSAMYTPDGYNGAPLLSRKTHGGHSHVQRDEVSMPNGRLSQSQPTKPSALQRDTIFSSKTGNDQGLQMPHSRASSLVPPACSEAAQHGRRRALSMGPAIWGTSLLPVEPPSSFEEDLGYATYTPNPFSAGSKCRPPALNPPVRAPSRAGMGSRLGTPMRSRSRSHLTLEGLDEATSLPTQRSLSQGLNAPVPMSPTTRSPVSQQSSTTALSSTGQQSSSGAPSPLSHQSSGHFPPQQQQQQQQGQAANAHPSSFLLAMCHVQASSISSPQVPSTLSPRPVCTSPAELHEKARSFNAQQPAAFLNQRKAGVVGKLSIAIPHANSLQSSASPGPSKTPNSRLKSHLPSPLVRRSVSYEAGIAELPRY